MSNANNTTPVLTQPATPPNTNVASAASASSLNAANLSKRLSTLKRKASNQAPASPVPSTTTASSNSEQRRKRYAVRKNFVWRQNPETGEAERLNLSKPENVEKLGWSKTGGRRTTRGKKSKKRTHRKRRHH